MSNYIKRKIKILDELHIQLTDEQKRQMKALHSEIAVDNYVKPIIINSYDAYGY